MSDVRRGRPEPAPDLVFLPLGGMGEIGMNCYAYGFGTPRNHKWILIDLGVKFGDETEPGIDVVVPDLAFLEAERANLLGIVLTHAHEDHIGAVTWWWERLRVPVYCTPFAAEVLKGKLFEAGLLEEVPLEVVAPGSRLRLGPFEVEFIPVTHSIPESNAIAVRTAHGTVLHSGDWKIDRTPTIPPPLAEERLRAIGAEGVVALVCDSTNVLRPGLSPSESEVAAALDAVVAAAPGRIAVTTFASHIGRLDSAIRAARRHGREVAVVGRAMRSMIDAAKAVGLLREIGEILPEEDAGYLPPEKTMLLCTGSQGEPRAALARIADGSHPLVTLDPGDTVVFSSRTIPGNEKAVSAVINNFARQNITIVTADQAPVHTSGHPRQGELDEFYRWLRPQLVVPMHGEAWHLQVHAKFAEAAGVPETVILRDGDLLRLAPGPRTIIDRVPSGRIHVDGNLLVPAVDGPARARRKLSFVGIVFVSLVLDQKGQVLSGPVIRLEGVPPVDEEGTPFEDFMLEVSLTALDSMPRARRRDDNLVRETVRTSVRRAAESLWGKRPLCQVTIHRL
ncbi:MAG TPA: ribonuclease J [Aestuariivirgaceae bacterium]|nr:ribonuclease J [Aestuariivirgaceae bacterium]